MKHSPEAIQSQIDKTAAARSAASIGAENAWTYIEHSGIKFYRPQLAHVWLLMCALREGIPITKHWPIVMGFILAHAQEDTLNKLLHIVRHGDIVDEAYRFMMSNSLCPDELTKISEELSADLENQKKKMSQPESSPSGGAV